jgi:hypothetical protein
MFHERLESSRQNGAAAANRLCEIIETPQSVERFAHHEQSPLLADDLERPSDRTVFCAVLKAG